MTGKKPPEKYYLVREDILPEVFLKVIEVKRLLDLKRVPSVNAAVRRVGISRSAYYKYRKAIRPLKTMEEGAVTTVLVTMEYQEHSAMMCLAVFLEAGAEIIGFQQTPPVDGLVHILATFRSGGVLEYEEALIYRLTQTRGVVRVESLRQT